MVSSALRTSTATCSGAAFRDLDALAHRVEAELARLLRGIAGDDAAMQDLLVSAAPWLPTIADGTPTWYSSEESELKPSSPTSSS